MDHSASRELRRELPVLSSVVARLRARRRRALNDRALALGTSPDSSAELARRAQWLARPATRARLVAELNNLIHAAEEPPYCWQAYGIDPPLRSDAVLAARTELVDLANRLASPEQPPIRGLALAAVLIEDPASPIYRTPEHADERDVADRAREASNQLDAPQAR